MQLYAIKLNERKVVDMRLMRQREKLSYSKLGVMFGVSYQAARRACIGITWRHVEVDGLSDDDVMTMRTMRHQGLSFADISRRFNVSHYCVSSVCRGLTRYSVGGYIDLNGAKKRCEECNFISWDNLCTECKQRGLK